MAEGFDDIDFRDPQADDIFAAVFARSRNSGGLIAPQLWRDAIHHAPSKAAKRFKRIMGDQPEPSQHVAFTHSEVAWKYKNGEWLVSGPKGD